MVVLFPTGHLLSPSPLLLTLLTIALEYGHDKYFPTIEARPELEFSTVANQYSITVTRRPTARCYGTNAAIDVILPSANPDLTITAGLWV
jgi:hypothetical protein